MSRHDLPPKLNNRFLYWLIGWYAILRHPIKRAIDLGEAAEIMASSDIYLYSELPNRSNR